ncbi:alpha-L-fucosidase [Dysgonomonas sp. Marseille-P4677]|uniref:alpha-L-fucosidase n=1 Tax=Dysgonomonas sp. Marseille-P4677 TaxID=2364790 RepID=UPI0019146768|nr:alpha-L-fucosidase [Dysgonomonas sp. Marseille-P4677]MBK5721270.1 alpha-L-fucosidase [Dysgonomonas sp. Marseille-P4677]
MKKSLLSLFLISFICINMFSQATVQKPDTKWFEDARFGMFVHFGPYSVLGAGEWVMNSRPIKGNNYMRLQKLFNPQAFDAKEWVRTAKNAGMKYIAFTSRHHDGFSNWDTKQSDWNIMNTPYGKDLIKQLSDECKKEDIKLVLYYSLLDWMRSDYQYETGRTGKAAGRTEKSNWSSYINFMKAQLTELLTNYEIAGIWFDGHWDQTADENRTDHSTHVDWHYPEIYNLIHTLKPGCLIANNHHLPPFEGEDYQVFERDVPGENKSGYSGQEVSRLPLETCETINTSWGFNITDDKFKSKKELLDLLIRTAGSGANLLLNVGPMPNGEIEQECVVRLQEMGEWMAKYGYTIYGTKAGFIKPQPWGAVTKKDKKYYIHILDNSTTSLTVNIPDIKSAKWINVNSALEWKKDKKSGDVSISIKGVLDDIDSIIEIEVK